MINNRKGFIFQNIFLLILSILLFVCSNPNFIFNKGLGFLAYFIYLPVLLLIHRTSFKTVWIYGIIYGAFSYGIFGYWLANFHPLGLAIAVISYSIILCVVFLVLKLIDKIFKRNKWLVFWLFICTYEYIKTLGFLGFSYGVCAYTQYRYPILIQICDVIGVFGFNALVIFPSMFLFSLINKNKIKDSIINNFEIDKNVTDTNVEMYLKKEKKLADNSTKSTLIIGGVWVVLIIICLIYGFVDLNKTNDNKYVTVAAIQNNEDPWKNGIEEYTKNVRNLINLTNEAMELNPEIEFVVWPETAVTPSILYQYNHPTDKNRYKLILNILNYINSKDAVFIIGNAHLEDNRKQTLDRFNSALVFESKKNVYPPKPQIYSKQKLVPFTEEFPHNERFPKLYKKMLNGDTQMWEKGTENTVFDYRGLKFSTPICFEDTFGFVCRNMVNNGSRCFINLSNDAWSKSVACQNQHLAMAIFRSVENRVPTVRSTSSGETCIINENGEIQNIIPEFCESYAVGKVPVLSVYKKSIYTQFGDIFGQLEIILFSVILIIQLIRVIIKNIKSI